MRSKQKWQPNHTESDGQSKDIGGASGPADDIFVISTDSKGLNVYKDVMRAIEVRAYGGPDRMKLKDNVEVPTPADNEVLIKVAAAGVNPVETYICSGSYSRKPALPYTPGTDAAGVVEEVGSRVKGFKKGDRVYTSCTVSGAYAEFATAESMFVNVLHERLSYAQGACIGVPYYTAAKALHIRGHAQQGETVVIHGASGNVGAAAVQISKALGLRVVGTAGTTEGLDMVRQLGADFVVNHREEGYVQAIKDATGGVDIVLEVLANVNLAKDIEMIKLHGRILVVGSHGHIHWDPFLTISKECSIIGVNIRETTQAEWELMHCLFRGGQQGGWLQPRVSKLYSLGEAATAHWDIMHNQRISGKLVLDTTT